MCVCACVCVHVFVCVRLCGCACVCVCVCSSLLTPCLDTSTALHRHYVFSDSDLAAADGLSFNHKINCTNHLLTVHFVYFLSFFFFFFKSSPSTFEAVRLFFLFSWLLYLLTACFYFFACLEVGEIKWDFNIKCAERGEDVRLSVYIIYILLYIYYIYVVYINQMNF